MSGPLGRRRARRHRPATGIGLRLLADGARVLVAVQGNNKLDAAGLEVSSFVGDPSPANAGGELLAVAVEALSGVDVLVNNAGVEVIRPPLRHTEEALRPTIVNNLWTTIRCNLHVLPHMV